MALFRNDSPGALTFEQAVRKAEWLEELQRRRNAAEAYHRQGRAVPPELEDESPPEDFSKPEEVKRITNGSPRALTMEQAIERHTAFLENERRRIAAEQKSTAEAKARVKKARMAESLSAEGRGDDSEVAHVTPGEMVIPHVFQTPEVLSALAKVATAHGVPLDRFRVGAPGNSINPNTGAAEFGLFGDVGDWFSRKRGLAPVGPGAPTTNPATQIPKFEALQNVPFAPPTGDVDPKLFSGSNRYSTARVVMAPSDGNYDSEDWLNRYDGLTGYRKISPGDGAATFDNDGRQLPHTHRSVDARLADALESAANNVAGFNINSSTGGHPDINSHHYYGRDLHP